MPASQRPPALFPGLLAAAYDRLPHAIRDLHDHAGTWRGSCTVERGNGVVARILGVCMALPPAGRHEPILVCIERSAGGEAWTRAIGGERMRSRLRGEGGLLVEQMGPATFRFALDVAEGRIHWRLHSVRALGIPLPRRAFEVTARESVERGRYRFQVRAALAGLGLLVAYDGYLLERVPP